MQRCLLSVSSGLLVLSLWVFLNVVMDPSGDCGWPLCYNGERDWGKGAFVSGYDRAHEPSWVELNVVFWVSSTWRQEIDSRAAIINALFGIVLASMVAVWSWRRRFAFSLRAVLAAGLVVGLTVSLACRRSIFPHAYDMDRIIGWVECLLILSCIPAAYGCFDLVDAFCGNAT